MKHIKSQFDDRRVSLDYLRSIQSEEVFDTIQPLYHLAHLSKITRILSSGLVPHMPEPTIHAGVIKGESFKGIWLSSCHDPYDIVDIHLLPVEMAYEGRVIKIDGSKLDNSKFSIGIELSPKLMRQVKAGIKISVNEYYADTSEIIYLGVIPPNALTIVDF